MGVQPARLIRGLRAPRRSVQYAVTVAQPDAVQAAPTPTVPVVFQQNDTVPDRQPGTACSGLTEGADTEDIGMSIAGIAGSLTKTVDVTTFATRAHVYFLSAANEPKTADWAAGTWTMRMRITSAGTGAVQIKTCHVCRIDQFGNNKGTVASVSDLTISCTAGVKSWDMTGSASSGLVSDRVQIVIGMATTVGPVTVGFRPDQTVDTPILQAA